MYGKLIEGELHIAPKKLPGDGVIVYNPPAAMYEAAGYKLIVFSDPPETEPGFHAEESWRETAKRIYQEWTIVEDPPDIDEYEAYQIIFGGDGT